MDLALGSIDFIEVFQSGVLQDERWYELLNAGFRVTVPQTLMSRGFYQEPTGVFLPSILY